MMMMMIVIMSNDELCRWIAVVRTTNQTHYAMSLKILNTSAEMNACIDLWLTFKMHRFRQHNNKKTNKKKKASNFVGNPFMAPMQWAESSILVHCAFKWNQSDLCPLEFSTLLHALLFARKLIRIYAILSDLCRVLNLSTRLINASHRQWQRPRLLADLLHVAHSVLTVVMCRVYLFMDAS